MADASDITIPLSELTARDPRIAELEAQVKKLTAIVESLQQHFMQNSSNSNLPPSSDGPGSGSAKTKSPLRPQPPYFR